MEFGGDSQTLHIQHHITGIRRLLLHLQLHRTANHHVGQFLLIGIADVDGTNILTLAKNRATVGNCHDLIELMGNEQDGFTLLGKPLHGCHQFLDLLGSQYCGRLVENQDLIVAVEHLEDFHSLLHTNGDILDLGIQVHLQAILFRQCLHLFPGSLLLQESQLGVFSAQDNIIQHSKHIHQLKVLVHHTDIQRCCIIRVINLDDLAVFLNDTFLRLIQTKQHAHQRRFTCTVFTKQCMDLAPLQLQRNVIICHNAGELFSDIEHFNNVF